jgi:hypothetical protein
MGIADHQLHARESALAQAPQEDRPEGLVLVVAHLDTKHLPQARRRDPNGHDHGPGEHLLAGLITPVKAVPPEASLQDLRLLHQQRSLCRASAGPVQLRQSCGLTFPGHSGLGGAAWLGPWLRGDSAGPTGDPET